MEDDHSKFPARVYAVQEEITDTTKALEEIDHQIDAEKRRILEKYNDSTEVKLHFERAWNQFQEKAQKFYEKINFKFHYDQLEKRTREAETLHESFQVCQKLYCVVAASNILTDDLNNAYESLRDRIVHGKKEVLFRDALMTTPVAERFNQLRAMYYMPFSTTPSSANINRNKLTIVRSVTPISRQLRETNYTANTATVTKSQPKFVVTRKVETVKMDPLDSQTATRKRTLRLAVQPSPSKRAKLPTTSELTKRTFTRNPRWR